MSKIETENLERSLQDCSLSIKPMPPGRRAAVLGKIPGTDDYFYIDQSNGEFQKGLRPRVMMGKPGRMKELKVLEGDPLSYDSVKVTDGEKTYTFQRDSGTGNGGFLNGKRMGKADVDPAQIDPKSDVPSTNPCTAAADHIKMSELKLPGRK